jgi:hypothetical protein
VIQLRRHLGFDPEPGQTIGIVSQRPRKHLQSDEPFEFGVLGEDDFAHTAGTQRVQDFVMAELGTRA